MNNKKYFLGVVMFLFIGCASLRGINTEAANITPYEYGLRTAKTDVDNYWAIYKAQQAALNAGTTVDYSGIESLTIEIPLDAKSIPLTSINDFKGIELIVKNSTKDFVLFSYEAKAYDIDISKEDIDKGRFDKYDELRRGKLVLAIRDQNLWVDNRKGYTYGHTRKDVLLINNGRSVNNPICPYNNEESYPYCKVYKDGKSISFENIVFRRDERAMCKTFLFSIQGTNDVRIKNIKAITPQSEMLDDCLMGINDCCNVIFENIDIDGTYSRSNHSGYGISLDNVWNYYAKNLVCKANWGIFGNNNVNTASLENCSINRFDVHCYGKDVSFKNVKFDRLYNQFSSIYGDIVFDCCEFNSFIPVLYESAYNAFTQHNVFFKDCVVNLSVDHNYLITTGDITKKQNSRMSILEKSLPNVVIKNMRVNVPSRVKDMMVFNIGLGTDKDVVINHLDKISIDGITFLHTGEAHPINLLLSNTDISTNQELSVEIKRLCAKKDRKKNTLLVNPGSVTIGLNKKNHKNIVTTKRINKFIINE